MAGNYPDVPGHRMAYHLDGTEGYVFTSAGVLNETLDQTDFDNLNDEDDDGGTSGTVPQNGYLSLKFPEPRVIEAARLFSTSGLTSFHGSNDTTDGFDGTWTSITIASMTTAGLVSDAYRTISPVTANGGPWRWVRTQKTGTGNANVRCWHIYGYSDPDIDRLAFWHPTLDQEVDGAYFDWDDVPRDTSQTKTFRIKNIGAINTTGGIDLTMSTPTGDLETQHALSSNGTDFFSSLNLSDLNAGAISGVLTLRFAPSSSYAMGVIPSGVMLMEADPNTTGVRSGYGYAYANTGVETDSQDSFSPRPDGVGYVYVNIGAEVDSQDPFRPRDGFGYVFQNTTTDTPPPTLWMVKPRRGVVGTVFDAIGKGFGATAGDRNAVVYFNGVSIPITDFQIVAATETGANMTIQPQLGEINVAHTAMEVTVPDVDPGDYPVEVEVD